MSDQNKEELNFIIDCFDMLTRVYPDDAKAYAEVMQKIIIALREVTE